MAGGPSADNAASLVKDLERLSVVEGPAGLLARQILSEIAPLAQEPLEQEALAHALLDQATDPGGFREAKLPA